MSEPVYKRVLIKISGEALAAKTETGKSFGLDPEMLDRVAENLKIISDMGVEIAIVVGGGNIFRGMNNSKKLGMDQASGDYVGMLATVMNAIALQSELRKIGVSCRVQSAINMEKIAEPYIRFKAIRHLEKGRVVIFAAGTGNPFFTTDTAAALRAAEIGADAMLMAKNGVDGIYSDDPKTNKNAVKYDKISYDDIIVKGLKVMDLTSCALCKQNNIPICVFDFNLEDSIIKILNNENIGTIVTE